MPPPPPPLIENKNIDQFAIPSFVTYSDDCDDDDEDEWCIDGSPIRNNEDEWCIDGSPIRNIFEIFDDDTGV